MLSFSDAAVVYVVVVVVVAVVLCCSILFLRDVIVVLALVDFVVHCFNKPATTIKHNGPPYQLSFFRITIL